MNISDAAIVGCQLGRPPRGRIEVAARCPYGLPLVIKTDPLLDDGEPFPTLYYLTCPAAVTLAGRLESSGMMRDLTAALESDPDLASRYRRAYVAYVAERDTIAVLPGAPGAGGMPDRVKCLHALYAHEAATGQNPVGAMVRERIEPLDEQCPGPCVADGVAAPGHPFMRGRS